MVGAWRKRRHRRLRSGEAPPLANQHLDGATARATEIARIYADHHWHGHGLGAALLRACIETAQEWGAEVIWLGVWERNPRAIAFYEKHGFRAVGEQEFQLGADRQRDVVMALNLTTAS